MTTLSSARPIETDRVARGRKTDAAIDRSTVPPLAEPASAFMSRFRDDDRLPDLVVGLIPSSGRGMTFGHPRTLKSFVALELAMACTTGTPAFGLEAFCVPTPVPTLYITEEDPAIEIRDSARRVGQRPAHSDPFGPSRRRPTGT